MMSPKIGDPAPPSGFSQFWDIYIPVGISSFPALLFSLMSAMFPAQNQPQGKPPAWPIILVIIVQVVAITAMAVVVLLRYEIAVRQLQQLESQGRIRSWQHRRPLLLTSMGCLTLFDLFLNVGAAFGAGLSFAKIALMFYLLYIVGIRLTFRSSAASPGPDG
jgi:hypothetical protein